MPIRDARPSAVCVHSRVQNGGLCRTCWPWPQLRSATQSPCSSWWKPTIGRCTAVRYAIRSEPSSHGRRSARIRPEVVGLLAGPRAAAPVGFAREPSRPRARRRHRSRLHELARRADGRERRGRASRRCARSRRDLGIDARARRRAGRAEALERERWREVVPPVVLAWDGVLVAAVRGAGRDRRRLGVEVTTEGGGAIRAHGRLFDLPADAHAWPGGVVHCVRTREVWLEGAARLSHGELADRGRRGRGARDRRADAGVRPAGLRARAVGRVRAGLRARVARRAARPAISRTLRAAVRRGRAPRRHATSRPCRSSRHSSTSRARSRRTRRRAGCSGTSSISICAQLAPRSASGAGRAADRAGALIDYRAQYAWRRAALDRDRAATARGSGASPPAIDAWARADGVYDYAAFRAIGEQQRTGWRAWPATLRDGAPCRDAARTRSRSVPSRARVDTPRRRAVGDAAPARGAARRRRSASTSICRSA